MAEKKYPWQLAPDERFAPYWKPFFAWRPVYLTHAADGYIMPPIGRHKKVWLKWIERLEEMPPGYCPAFGASLPFYRDPEVEHLFTPEEWTQIVERNNKNWADRWKPFSEKANAYG